ncbi:hypothetical protein GCM10010324_05690 [Streptomyces hiroshimensis]|uniref:CHAT domain-containing protein n=1 Tax=Streptomyces hiroshimensis TaxID=66424 RepID=A0ABQ2Y4K3_9ACTN|nr:hypothetical protein GCM10010324_05690 [Streptomyces hiroshimensis]
MHGAADFVLEVSGGPGGQYTVAVSSPAGEGSLSVALDTDAIGARLADLQRAVLASSVTPRAAALGLERPVREVGERLFRTVFGGHLRGLYLASRQRAGERDEALRVVLRIRAPELASLPWELLYDEDLGEYLCLHRPLVRYVDLPEPLAPLRSDPPLRVLGMTSLPRSRAPLDAESERAALAVALGPLTERGLVDLDWVPGRTADDLSRRLLRGCHVLHFIGHGAYDPERHEGMITLADADGREHHLHASALASLLSVARPRPQLVILNSCQSGMGNAEDLFSSTAAVLVRTVPAVVAMQFAVTDKAATRFAASFYQALAQGRTVDEAVRVGRIALVVDKDDSLEWATPVLYLRGGDARLFEMPAAWADAGPAVPLPGPYGADGPDGPDSPDGPSAALPPKPRAAPTAPAAPGAVITSRVLDTRQWVHALAFHPDGRRLATGSRNRVRVWDALTGNRIWEQPVGGWLSSVFAAGFSPGGRRLVTGGRRQHRPRLGLLQRRGAAAPAPRPRRLRRGLQPRRLPRRLRLRRPHRPAVGLHQRRPHAAHHPRPGRDGRGLQPGRRAPRLGLGGPLGTGVVARRRCAAAPAPRPRGQGRRVQPRRRPAGDRR